MNCTRPKKKMKFLHFLFHYCLNNLSHLMVTNTVFCKIKRLFSCNLELNCGQSRSEIRLHRIRGAAWLSGSVVNPFPNKPWFLRVCNTSLLKTLWEKEKLLVTSNFSFSHRVFYPFAERFAILIKLNIVFCKLF